VLDIAVVRGYRKEAIDLPSITTIDNDGYATTNEAASLACAAGYLEGGCLVCYGDVLFSRYILDGLMETEGDIVVGVDTLWRDRADRSPGRTADLAECSRPFTGDPLDDEPVTLVAIGDGLAANEVGGDIHGEWIGLAKLSENGAKCVREALDALAGEGKLETAGMPDLFGRLIAAGHEIRVAYSAGHWLDVNDAFDLARARNVL